MLAEPQSDRSIGEKKLRTSGDERPSMKELSGYNFKRQEFEIEYDNDAEHLLADMEFNKNDTDAERELKLRVLHIYGKRYLCTHMNVHVLGIRYHVQGLWTGLLLNLVFSAIGQLRKCENLSFRVFGNVYVLEYDDALTCGWRSMQMFDTEVVFR